MIRPILAYGDPILNLKAEKINFSESKKIDSLINDLWDTMYNAKGVGIAAPQIGVSKSIFVADFTFFEDEDNFYKDELINIKQVFINPKIIKESGNDLRELDKRRKNIGLNLNYKLFVYIFLAIVVINVVSRQC